MVSPLSKILFIIICRKSFLCDEERIETFPKCDFIAYLENASCSLMPRHAHEEVRLEQLISVWHVALPIVSHNLCFVYHTNRIIVTEVSARKFSAIANLRSYVIQDGSKFIILVAIYRVAIWFPTHGKLTWPRVTMPLQRKAQNQCAAVRIKENSMSFNNDF